MARVASRGRGTQYGLRTRAQGSGGLRGVVAAAILVGWRVAAGSWKKGKEAGRTSSPRPWESGLGPPKLRMPERRSWTLGLRRENGSSASPYSDPPPSSPRVAYRARVWGSGVEVLLSQMLGTLEPSDFHRIRGAPF